MPQRIISLRRQSCTCPCRELTLMLGQKNGAAQPRNPCVELPPRARVQHTVGVAYSFRMNPAPEEALASGFSIWKTHPIYGLTSSQVEPRSK